MWFDLVYFLTSSLPCSSCAVQSRIPLCAHILEELYGSTAATHVCAELHAPRAEGSYDFYMVTYETEETLPCITFNILNSTFNEKGNHMPPWNIKWEICRQNSHGKRYRVINHQEFKGKGRNGAHRVRAWVSNRLLMTTTFCRQTAVLQATLQSIVKGTLTNCADFAAELLKILYHD